LADIWQQLGYVQCRNAGVKLAKMAAGQDPVACAAKPRPFPAAVSAHSFEIKAPDESVSSAQKHHSCLGGQSDVNHSIWPIGIVDG
jgi:hypothetical protein